MPRVEYTAEEVTLCTYAAMYDSADFGGDVAIRNLRRRPEEKHSMASIKMKIQNIASMLDEREIPRENNRIAPLTGKTTGENGRTTNWDIVQRLYNLEREVFLQRCVSIIETARNRGVENQ